MDSILISGEIRNWLLTRATLRGFNLYLWLYLKSNEFGKVHEMSIDRIAKELHWGKTTVRNHLKWLEESGHLKREGALPGRKDYVIEVVHRCPGPIHEDPDFEVVDDRDHTETTQKIPPEQNTQETETMHVDSFISPELQELDTPPEQPEPAPAEHRPPEKEQPDYSLLDPPYKEPVQPEPVQPEPVQPPADENAALKELIRTELGLNESWIDRIFIHFTPVHIQQEYGRFKQIYVDFNLYKAKDLTRAFLAQIYRDSESQAVPANLGDGQPVQQPEPAPEAQGQPSEAVSPGMTVNIFPVLQKLDSGQFIGMQEYSMLPPDLQAQLRYDEQYYQQHQAFRYFKPRA